MIEETFEISRARVWARAEVDFQSMVAFHGEPCRLENLASALDECPELFESEWSHRCSEVATRLCAMKSLEILPTIFRFRLEIPDDVSSGVGAMVRSLAEAYLARTLLGLWIDCRRPELAWPWRAEAEKILETLGEAAGFIHARPFGRRILHFP